MLPAEFRWLPGWLAPAEAERLFGVILSDTPWEDHQLRMGGRVLAMPRRVAFYGPFAYAYSGLVHPARALTPCLDDLRRRVENAAGVPFNTILLNLYRSGADSVSWHSDDDYPNAGRTAVASLSLGATRRFRIAHKRRSDERYTLELTSGGLLVMEGDSQASYRHALPKSAAVAEPRINLTFRYMAASNAPPTRM
jgi:alkylated DNA repair dioxygenase AlkB